jgi:hypothetical protein
MLSNPSLAAVGTMRQFRSMVPIRFREDSDMTYRSESAGILMSLIMLVLLGGCAGATPPDERAQRTHAESEIATTEVPAREADPEAAARTDAAAAPPVIIQRLPRAETLYAGVVRGITEIESPDVYYTHTGDIDLIDRFSNVKSDLVHKRVDQIVDLNGLQIETGTLARDHLHIGTFLVGEGEDPQGIVNLLMLELRNRVTDNSGFFFVQASEPEVSTPNWLHGENVRQMSWRVKIPREDLHTVNQWWVARGNVIVEVNVLDADFSEERIAAIFELIFETVRKTNQDSPPAAE